MKEHSSNQNTQGTGIKCSSQNVITRPHQSLQFRLWDSTLATFPYSIMIKLRAIGRCLFFLQSRRTSNYVRSVAMSWFQSEVCVMERLRKKLYSNYMYEMRRAQLNQMKRRRRRHPPPPPARNLPFVTLPSVRLPPSVARCWWNIEHARLAASTERLQIANRCYR